MTDYEKLTKLRLRQARRRELPLTFFKALFGTMLVLALLTGVTACLTKPETPLTQKEKDDNSRMLNGGHKKAHDARLP